MEIRQIDVTVRELIEGYSEKPESGEVVAYGGRTILDNGRMLCIDCNLKKGGKSPAR